MGDMAANTLIFTLELVSTGFRFVPIKAKYYWRGIVEVDQGELAAHHNHSIHFETHVEDSSQSSSCRFGGLMVVNTLFFAQQDLFQQVSNSYCQLKPNMAWHGPMWTKENWPHLTSLFRPMQRIVVSLAAVKLGDMAMNTLIFAKEFLQSIGQHGPIVDQRELTMHITASS